MGRAPCCDKANVKKGPWSPEEDSKLKEYIEKYGTGGNWIALPQKAGLKRCGKSCRLRWLNYLRPNIKHGEFSDEEDRIICTLFASIGSRWSIIAAQLPGRTDNDIKNYWNTKLKKKLMAMSTATQSQRNTKPIPFPSPPSFPSNVNSYPFNNNNIKPFSSALFEPINSQIIPSSNLFQIQQGTLISSPLQYYHPIKESSNNNNNNLLVFGSEASCSSNSDGSCSQISYGGGPSTTTRDQIKQELDLGFQSFISNGFQENHKFMLNYSNGGESLNQWAADHKANGYFGETITAAAPTPLEYDLEDVKQLISSSSTNGTNECSNYNNNNNNYNNLLIDENKTQEKFMYYY